MPLGGGKLGGLLRGGLAQAAAGAGEGGEFNGAPAPNKFSSLLGGPPKKSLWVTVVATAKEQRQQLLDAAAEGSAGAIQGLIAHYKSLQAHDERVDALTAMSRLARSGTRSAHVSPTRP